MMLSFRINQPSFRENPKRDGKEHYKAITLRNDRQIEQPIRETVKEAEPSSIQNKPGPQLDTKADQNVVAERNAIAKLQQSISEYYSRAKCYSKATTKQIKETSTTIPQRFQNQKQNKQFRRFLDMLK